MIQRTTELRLLESNQVHEISLILDENEGWRHVMSLIPKIYDAKICSFDGSCDWDRLTDEVGHKYTNDQIRKVENPRQGDSRLPAEIFIDEWSTSGRKENRPTVGVFLQLLVKAQLFRAADYVAEKWLCEPPPTRPSKGPAARVNTSLPSAFLNEVASFANDSAFQPDTDDLLQNAQMMNGKLEINHDFYTKLRYDEKTWSAFDNTPPTSTTPTTPAPPPRKNRKSERMLSLEQRSPNHHRSSATEFSAYAATTATMNGSVNGEFERNKTTTTTTSTTVNGVTKSTEINVTDQLPILPAFFPNLRSDDMHEIHVVSTSNIIHNSQSTPTSTSTENYGNASIPLLSVLQNSLKSNDETSMTDINNLPLISALNLNDQQQQHDNRVAITETKTETETVESISENRTQENQQNGLCGNEDDEQDDDSNDDSKLGSSNNDSSLTNITGTSGENSFEMSSRSTSNENIPVHVLQY